MIQQQTVLILSAGIGGGHTAAGDALRIEIEQLGGRAVLLDGLHTMDPGLAWLLEQSYATQLAHLPRSLSPVFSLTSVRSLAALIRWSVGFAFGERLLKLIASIRPSVIVSTYPLVTSTLGYLRRQGRVNVPVVGLVPDFGIHPLWVAEGADVHIVASRLSARLARRAGGHAHVAQISVGPAFQAIPDRVAARFACDLPIDRFITLIVGGAWGSGDIEGATRSAMEAGVFTVVVTGKNDRLRARLEAQCSNSEHVRIIGWTSQMALLMGAADCLVQNAGGMTCLEAIEARLPIVIYNPIPGHGAYNAAVMERAGTANWVKTRVELTALLSAAAQNQAELTRPRWESETRAASMVLSLASESLPASMQPVWIQGAFVRS
ncbi:MAG: galactosyldiacylglycerol synthase [Herpetosiphon sp.]